MPRQSSASLSVRSLSGTPPRLRPPADLAELERKVFVDIVTSCKATHFAASDMPLLTAYCRAVVMEQQASGELARAPVVDGEVSPWLRIQTAALKAMVALSMRLRLSPQGRSPTNPKRPESISYYEQMDLERHQDDADDYVAPTPSWSRRP
jgi:phage terminase small subunit